MHRTDSNQVDINRFRSYTGNIINLRFERFETTSLLS